jgi:hypothetical protein
MWELLSNQVTVAWGSFSLVVLIVAICAAWEVVASKEKEPDKKTLNKLRGYKTRGEFRKWKDSPQKTSGRECFQKEF